MLSIVIVVIIGNFIGNDSSTTKVEVNQTDKRKKRDEEFQKRLNEDLMKRQLERRREEIKKVERKIYVDSHKYLDKKIKGLIYVSKLADNQKIVDGYLYHTDKAIRNSGATISEKTRKIEKLIIEDKVPNGTNRVYVEGK